MDFKIPGSDYTLVWVQINYNHLPQIHAWQGQVRQLHWGQVEDGFLLAHFEAPDVQGCYNLQRLRRNQTYVRGDGKIWSTTQRY